MFDQHMAVLLNACGYTATDYEAHWEDVGGPENGPKLSGHPAFTEWSLPIDDTCYHSIIVERGVIVDSFVAPTGPDDSTPF